MKPNSWKERAVARKSTSSTWFLRICLFLGLAFLYIPLLVLVVYSFNRSELVTVWGGFSTKWYGALLNNSEILEATWLSIRIALISSAAAVVLGTMAAYALARIKRFRGSTLFTGMVSAPMVMPDIITGISLVMLILQVQALLRGSSLSWLQFERGWFTIWLGHTTLCMAYVTVVIRTRLGELDQSLEEAAQDLGAKPWKIFWVITLPLIAPAIASGFLLAMTLSMDDLVITSFLSGPNYTSLPQLIFAKVKRGVNPQMNVLATFLITIIGTLVITGNYLMMRRVNKRDREAALAYKQAQEAAAAVATPPPSALIEAEEAAQEADDHAEEPAATDEVSED